ncbi:hypothetical protein C0J52_04338, partial [Blattella germanica]
VTFDYLQVYGCFFVFLADRWLNVTRDKSASKIRMCKLIQSLKLLTMSQRLLDWNFFLKRWWVRWRLWRLQYPYQVRKESPETAFMPSQEDADLEAQRMLIEDKEVNK